MHKICFSDVYSWAGELRTIRIAKGKTVFSYPENIEQEADKYFSEINQFLKTNSLTNQDEMIDMMIAGYNGDYDPITALFQKLMHRP